MRTLEEYYKRSFGSAKGNLQRRGDKYIAINDAQELLSYHYAMYKLPFLTLLNEGKPTVIPDNPSSLSPTTDSIPVTMRFDIEKDVRTDKSVKLELANIDERERLISCDENGFFIKVSLQPKDAKQVTEEWENTVENYVKKRNAEINLKNQILENQLREVITQYKSKLKDQSDLIKRIAEIIPLSQKENPSAPIVPLAKKKQITVNPPRATATFPKIDPKILDAIIDVLIRGGLTFEAAPETFRKLTEPDLRNILLSFLNGNFQIFASAEAFNKLGKADISLRYSGDNLFVAECKNWKNPKYYLDGITQLFRYLTWRENVGVLITFVKRNDLFEIVKKAKEIDSVHPTFIKNSMRVKGDSYFISSHIFPEDKEKTVEVHHLLFSIHSPRKESK